MSVLVFFVLVGLGLAWMFSPPATPSNGLPGEPDRYPVPTLAGGWHGDLDEFGRITIRGLVLNETDRSWHDILVSVRCYDAQHRDVGFAHDYLPLLPPGQNWRFNARPDSLGLCTVRSFEKPVVWFSPR